MKDKTKRPLRRCILERCAFFVFALCVVLGILNYTSYRRTLYGAYEDYIENVLRYTEANIDADDLRECIETGVESEKYQRLQVFLDGIKEHMDLDYLYVIIPLNTEPFNNIQNVIAGVSSWEYENLADVLVYLNMPTGDSYSPESAGQYLKAYESGVLTFFEEISEWGDAYTGLLPLYDSSGERVAALCMDVDIQIIHTKLHQRVLILVGLTLLLGLVFTAFFIRWTRRDVILPLQQLERGVSKFAEKSHLGAGAEELVLDVPEIHSRNEVESLANAVRKMSQDIRDYAGSLEKAEAEAREKSFALSEALAAAEEANRAKTSFLSNMSHEIRTPMNAIIGLDSIALDEKGLSPSTRDYLEKIGASAKHLLNIINDILDMSRIESGRMVIRSEEFSLAKTLEQVNTIMNGQCSEKGLSYECRIVGNLGEYFIGDDMKLRQVLINILGNAVKFTPEGGEVTLIVEQAAWFERNVTLQFLIRDTGIGMSEEFLPRIFDSFSQEDSTATNKYGSTGLGMAITKNLVELMNGEISVESKKGEGTTFTVKLTLKESERTPGREEKDIPPGEMSVLIIDDDPVACEHAKLILAQEGISCETAQSGAEAISMVKLRNARRAPYNLILVDWRMPEMNGVETTRRIRSIVGNDSAIIILTAYNWDDIQEEAKAAGVDSFAPKPLFVNSVLTEFRSAYGRRKGYRDGEKAELTGRRILIAEDLAINAEIMVMVVQARGMEAEVAGDGKAAVDLFTSHPEGYYDAILMDMRMPVMDGLEATKAIREMDRSDAKTIPIIALTANAFDEDVHRSLQAGLNAHLSKPVEPESLYETLASLIRT